MDTKNYITKLGYSPNGDEELLETTYQEFLDQLRHAMTFLSRDISDDRMVTKAALDVLRTKNMNEIRKMYLALADQLDDNDWMGRLVVSAETWVRNNLLPIVLQQVLVSYFWGKVEQEGV